MKAQDFHNFYSRNRSGEPCWRNSGHRRNPHKDMKLKVYGSLLNVFNSEFAHRFYWSWSTAKVVKPECYTCIILIAQCMRPLYLYVNLYVIHVIYWNTDSMIWDVLEVAKWILFLSRYFLIQGLHHCQLLSGLWIWNFSKISSNFFQ